MCLILMASVERRVDISQDCVYTPLVSTDSRDGHSLTVDLSDTWQVKIFSKLPKLSPSNNEAVYGGRH